MDILEISWRYERKIEDFVKHLGKGRYGRVMRMTRKPDNEEYGKVLQITGIGLILIGAIGFLIYLMWNFLPGYLKNILGL
jgi:protein transport protein SEC61 subunit gamma-like protein